MAVKRGIFVVAGYGNGTGTGSASAEVFAKAGYKVALIARGADHIEKGAKKIIQDGGEAKAFPLQSYDSASVHSVFESIKAHWPDEAIRVTLYNAAQGIWKPFLEITPEEWDTTANINLTTAAAFARESILSFKDLPLNELGKRGTLLFTGATASIRGNKTTSAFSAGKFALRSLSQSLSKEFGKQNIHVAHAVIDGAIITDMWKDRAPGKYEEWQQNLDGRLSPESIANSYLYLAHQDRSAWTWELDLRPAHENW
ncbi:NAD(P)-binding protein [Sistotremastrum suecicum HHB10207 ss-3]|uniref:NAD(P)-binding protein n=1 Tax=Sistotremastrum suecicum HHB10207 ss-3 TaxID=1314776 RepID=A0A166BMS3_9AGAM|nr:NAD(P)-binding protein [Sistotremastrum suecicum HHB10207 ss-3]